jgi:hypothetical protein
MSEPSFEQVVREGVAFQERFAGEPLIAVGGTAAALHCRHRYSLDVDCVTPRLRENFQGHLARLEGWADWRTNRKNPPVLILGERHGVELGLRQLRRTQPLEATKVDGLVIPTPEEMLRVKAFLLAERRSTRDFIDVAAMMKQLGDEASIRALQPLNQLYPAFGLLSPISALAEAAEAEPGDFDLVPLDRYKGLRAPFTDWPFVRDGVRRLTRRLLRLELETGPPDGGSAA